MRRGLGQAAGALVIADGAVWIWRLADDRFSQARQRLDYYHAVQHLAAAGRTLFGEDNGKLRNWDEALLCLETFRRNNRWHLLAAALIW
jgi:hypothetical protein